MLNPFPTMWLSLLAYFVLRVFIGFTLLHLGIKHLHNLKQLDEALMRLGGFVPKGIGITLVCFEVGIAVFLIAGYRAQYACLAGLALFTLLFFYRNKIRSSLLPGRHYYVLLIGALLSLFITGAGAFAFDLPL